MVLKGFRVRGVTEDMGPDGRPVTGHLLTIHMSSAEHDIEVTFTGDGFLKLFAMLDPWARALEAEKSGRAGEVERG